MPKPIPSSTKRGDKSSVKAREMALKEVEVVEFTPSPINGEETPTMLSRTPMESDSGTDDDILASHPVPPVTIPIELVMPSLECKENLIALLDSGCTRCTPCL